MSPELLLAAVVFPASPAPPAPPAAPIPYAALAAPAPPAPPVDGDVGSWGGGRRTVISRDVDGHRVTIVARPPAAASRTPALSYRDAEGRDVQVYSDGPVTRGEADRLLAEARVDRERARAEGRRARAEGERAREEGRRAAAEGRAAGERARAEAMAAVAEARREGEGARAEGMAVAAHARAAAHQAMEAARLSPRDRAELDGLRTGPGRAELDRLREQMRAMREELRATQREIDRERADR